MAANATAGCRTTRSRSWIACAGCRPTSPSRSWRDTSATSCGTRCASDASRSATSWSRWTGGRRSTSSSARGSRSTRWAGRRRRTRRSSSRRAPPASLRAGWLRDRAGGDGAPAEPARPAYRVGPSALGRWTSSHVGDQLLDAIVHAAERVLAEHRPLGLVVQLEVHPVHRVVAPLLLRVTDEVPPQLGPRRLRGLPHGPLDLLLRDGAFHLARALEHVVQAACAIDVVVREVQERDTGVRERQLVAGAKVLDQALLGDPIDLAHQPLRLLQDQGVERLAPLLQQLFGLRIGTASLQEAFGALVVLLLHLDRRKLPPVGQPDLLATGHVV